MSKIVETINLNIVGMGEVEVKKGEKLKNVIKKVNEKSHKDFLGAKINNEIKHLDY
ncbi:hypothetical protein [Caldisalinibacter kiritimatiensis]|uniref:Uncharacterized protein n=1 Tax=Caldisalinibacter kiritimatiensis TaxID=1304284 RepID=R1AWP2_9FIRM|nr:hypothetical protein [Caldisalinibacter kiritimatiensis]EOD01608.1 hypothetical protein L21TH_0347 [Caldisalinibacter kiritimatiensis]